MALTDLEFYAVVPKEATNLITNPSIEIDTTGYTLLQSALARVTTYQRRGVASMSITPNANQIAGAYYAVSLTAGTQYSFSADILDVNGQSFSLWFADNAGALVGSAVTWTGNGHWKRRSVPYTAAATTTGSRWSINGPGSPTLLHYRSEYTLTATSVTANSATAYDIPAASNATSLTAGNIATIWGIIKPSSDGTVVARFASEVSSSAIVAKAGATLRWVRVL